MFDICECQTLSRSTLFYDLRNDPLSDKNDGDFLGVVQSIFRIHESCDEDEYPVTMVSIAGHLTIHGRCSQPDIAGEEGLHIPS